MNNNRRRIVLWAVFLLSVAFFVWFLSVNYDTEGKFGVQKTDEEIGDFSDLTYNSTSTVDAEEYPDYGNRALLDMEKKLQADYPNTDIVFRTIEPPLVEGKEYLINQYSNSKTTFSSMVGDYLLLSAQLGEYLSSSTAYEITLFKNKKLLSSKKVDGYSHSLTAVIDYKDDRYYLFDGWSGGMHCCYVSVPAKEGSNAVELGDPVFHGNVFWLNKNNLFIKDGQVYIYALDDRFAYFYSSFAGSSAMFFPIFYKFEGAKIVDVSNEFKSYYEQIYTDTDLLVEQLKEKNLIKDEYYFENIFPHLVFRLSIGLFADKDDKKLWQELRDDYVFFFGEDDFEQVFAPYSDPNRNSTVEEFMEDVDAILSGKHADYGVVFKRLLNYYNKQR